MPGLSGAALEARDRLVDTSLETNKQTQISNFLLKIFKKWVENLEQKVS